jgi:ankyrin repeat protein
LQLLLKNGIEFDISTHTASKLLLESAEKGREDMVKLLLDTGADIQVSDDRGRTPLHLAAMNGYYGIASSFCEEEPIPR